MSYNILTLKIIDFNQAYGGRFHFIFAFSFSVCKYTIFKRRPYKFEYCRNANKIPLITYINFTEGVKNPNRECLSKLSYIHEQMNWNCFRGSCDSDFNFIFEPCGITEGSYKLDVNYACIKNGSLYSSSNTTSVLPNTLQDTQCFKGNKKLYFLSNSGYPDVGKPVGRRYVTVKAQDKVRPITVNVLSCDITVIRSDNSTICDREKIYQPQFEFTDTVTFIYDNTGFVYQGFLFQLEGTV